MLGNILIDYYVIALGNHDDWNLFHLSDDIEYIKEICSHYRTLFPHTPVNIVKINKVSAEIYPY